MSDVRCRSAVSGQRSAVSGQWSVVSGKNHRLRRSLNRGGGILPPCQSHPLRSRDCGMPPCPHAITPSWQWLPAAKPNNLHRPSFHSHHPSSLFRVQLHRACASSTVAGASCPQAKPSIINLCNIGRTCRAAFASKRQLANNPNSELRPMK